MHRFGSALWLGLVASLCVVQSPTSSQALEIQLSDPFYRVFNAVTKSTIEEDFATFAVLDSRSNTTGDLTFASDVGYAAVEGYSDGFSLHASSQVDGSQLSGLGLDSATGEGNTRFQTNLRLLAGDTRPVTLEIPYLFEVDVVSTDQRARFGEPGTDAGSHLRNVRIFDTASNDLVFAALLQPGSHVLSAMLDGETLYRLEVVFNAVSGAKDSTGFASAHSRLDFSIAAVPEPALGLLLGIGLVVLAGWPGAILRSTGLP